MFNIVNIKKFIALRNKEKLMYHHQFITSTLNTTSTVKLAHKIELIPTTAQIEYFAKACGVSRFAYNWALASWNSQYREWKEAEEEAKKNGTINTLSKPKEYELRKQFNSIKKEKYPFVEEITKCAVQQSIKDLGVAFVRFFKKTSNYPQFHKKGRHDSFYMDNVSFKVVGKRIHIPKLGWVKMRENLRFYGKIMSATVSRIADRWFVSIQVDVPFSSLPVDHEPYNQNNSCCENQTVLSDSMLPLGKDVNLKVVGIDLGIKTMATLFDGEQSKIEKIDAPKPLKRLLTKLKRLQRKLSRQGIHYTMEDYVDANGETRKIRKYSNNYIKTKIKLARLHARIRNIRQDFLHKLTTRLVKEFDVICIEDLNVKGMMANHKLARAIMDLGFYEFKRQLLYKAQMWQRMVIIADRWYPSSKTCSHCGEKLKELELSDRDWECPHCHTTHDRDVNAAMNLRKLYFNNLSVVEPATQHT